MFSFKVNDEDVYSLVKEEVDFDPSKTEECFIALCVNDIKDWAMNGYAPWIFEDVEEKISTALGANQLTCVRIHELVGKAVVPNEFLDLLTFYVADNGLEKLEMRRFRIESEQGGTLDI